MGQLSLYTLSQKGGSFNIFWYDFIAVMNITTIISCDKRWGYKIINGLGSENHKQSTDHKKEVLVE